MNFVEGGFYNPKSLSTDCLEKSSTTICVGVAVTHFKANGCLYLCSFEKH